MRLRLWASILGDAALVAILFLVLANFALDHKQPQEGSARAWLVGALVAGIVALEGIAYFLARAHDLVGFWIGSPLGLLTFWPLAAMAMDYGREGRHFLSGSGLGYTIAIVALGIPVLVCLIVAALLEQRHPRGAAGTLAGLLAALATGATAVAIYMLVTLPEQVETSTRANRTPPASLGAVVILLLVVAAVCRRRE